MAEDLTIKLGDFEIIALDKQSSTNSQNPRHMAYVRYNGIISAGNKSILIFDIGRYDGHKDIQTGSPYYLPTTEKKIECRVDTYGRRVKLEIMHISPLEIKAKNLTETPSAVDG